MSAGAGEIRVLAVDAALGRPLRMAVLRPEEPADGQMYPLEEHPATLHFAVLGEGQEVLSVGSVMPEAHPRDPREHDWRVRGMATRPDLRGSGLGSRLLEEIVRVTRERHGARLWCNARAGARQFYEHAGFRIEGEEYEIAGIGPHFLMSRALD
ncbi:MAG: family N-acetyltransferase [Solirubrobacterales bacterium]|nr:family N-acetyltransferase [Solirubrobacterales bacterium]